MNRELQLYSISRRRKLSYERGISHINIQLNINREGEGYMEYIKPAVIKPETVNSAKCGSGPCGRPK